MGNKSHKLCNDTKISLTPTTQTKESPMKKTILSLSIMISILGSNHAHAINKMCIESLMMSIPLLATGTFAPIATFLTSSDCPRDELVNLQFKARQYKIDGQAGPFLQKLFSDAGLGDSANSATVDDQNKINKLVDELMDLNIENIDNK